MGRPADAARHFRLAQRADGGLFEGLAHDFASALPQAEIHAPSPGYVLNAHFAIGGDERRALYAHPDSRVVYPVQVPHGAVLTFALGTSPDSWGQPGDGVEFAVIVADRERTEPVFARYIDPKRDADDRRWHDVAVDLAAYGGRTVRIVFQTTSGPAADSRFDWAVWGEPRLWAP